MSTATNIEWTDATWNPTRGCSRVSPGCQACYAERQAIRHAGEGRPFAGLVRSTPSGPRWTGDVRLIEEALTLPLRWRKPRRIFVDSMSDLFHESLGNPDIDRVFAAMALCPQHTFQILTKRADHMRAYMEGLTWERVAKYVRRFDGAPRSLCHWSKDGDYFMVGPSFPSGVRAWPLPNVWLGVSVEDQARADERIPHLLAVPAAVRFLSVEPLLGPVDLGAWLPRPALGLVGIDWVIVGGESGPSARPCRVEWIRDIQRQCREASVPCFVKQLGSVVSWSGIQGGHGDGPSNVWPRATGSWEDAAMPGGYRKHLCDKKGGDPSEWPEDLRVREFPPRRGAQT